MLRRSRRRSARRHAVAGVLEQVHEHGPQPLRVGRHAAGQRVEGEPQRDALAALERRAGRVGRERVHVDGGRLEAQRAREVEHVAHHAVEARDLLLDVGGRLAHLHGRGALALAACAASP